VVSGDHNTTDPRPPDSTNVVPDRVTFRIGRRMIPEEVPGAVEDELRAAIAGAAASSSPEARVEMWRTLLAEPLVPGVEGERVAAILCRHPSRAVGGPVEAGGVPLADLRHAIELVALTSPEPLRAGRHEAKASPGRPGARRRTGA
jgi:hypothetical protein